MAPQIWAPKIGISEINPNHECKGVTVPSGSLAQDTLFLEIG